MIEKLIIENFALIDKVTIDFRKGFTVITGETGSGKSIMLDALSLLLGGRADSNIVGDKTKKTVIEAIFSDVDSNIKKILGEIEADDIDGRVIIRREISAGSRSRIFINDSPVTLGVLTKISPFLIDIHSQNSNFILQQSSGQLEMIDSFAKDRLLLEEYRTLFHRFVEVRSKIKKIRENIEKDKADKEFIEFRLQQLSKLNPKEGEFSKLEKEYDLLTESDSIKESLEEAVSKIDRSDYGAANSISEAAGMLEKINLNVFNENEDNEIVARLKSLVIDLRDISETLTDYLERLETNPRQMASVSARLNLYYEAMRQFKVKDAEELVNVYKDLKSRLSLLSEDGDEIKALEQEARNLAPNLKEKADLISKVRMEAAGRFSDELTSVARLLGLQNLIFKVNFEKGKLTSDGQDKIEFFCTFNKNHPLQSMSKIASGGEISRLMLSIKSIMAKCMDLPTVVFDEVDTGVSGEIARKMGNMMKKMAEDIQVLSITHLPQVASRGEDHFKVYKTDDNEKTTTHINRLNEEERVREIASMLSGTIINEAAMENARALLKNEN